MRCHLGTQSPLHAADQGPAGLMSFQDPLHAAVQGTSGPVLSSWDPLSPASSVSEAGGSGSQEDTTSTLGP